MEQARCRPPNAIGPLVTSDQALTAARLRAPEAGEVAPFQPNQAAGPAARPLAPPAGPSALSIPGYVIEGLLGRGCMGIVYKARHLKLKRTVALKMMLAGKHARPHELARFRTEAEVVARLLHPNIVQIHEVGEADGHPYLALEFVAGSSLASKIMD